MHSEIGIDIEHDVNIHLENRSESRHFFVFIWLLYAMVTMTKNCFNAALPSIVAEGLLTKSQTGAFTSLFYLVYAPMQVVGGLAVDRYSPERLIKVGLCGAILANLVICFNQNYYVMLAAWIFNGIIQFGIWPGVYKIVSSQLVRSERVTMTFFISFAASFGQVVSYLIGALITDWRMNFVVSVIVLVVLTVVLEVYCRHLTPYMKWDRKEAVEPSRGGETTSLSTAKLFALSGCLVVIVVAFLRNSVEQASKTLAPIMLMERYESVSPNMGNSFNIVVLVCGILGMILVRKFIYPKRIKNELVGLITIIAIATPATAVLLFVGRVELFVVIIAFCVSCAAYTGSGMFISFYANRFVKYGKNGTVAGAFNAAGAMGSMMASYGFLAISEVSNWETVTAVLLGMGVVSIILLVSVLPRYRKFKEM